MALVNIFHPVCAILLPEVLCDYIESKANVADLLELAYLLALGVAFLPTAPPAAGDVDDAAGVVARGLRDACPACTAPPPARWPHQASLSLVTRSLTARVLVRASLCLAPSSEAPLPHPPMRPTQPGGAPRSTFLALDPTVLAFPPRPAD